MADFTRVERDVKEYVDKIYTDEDDDDNNTYTGQVWELGDIVMIKNHGGESEILDKLVSKGLLYMPSQKFLAEKGIDYYFKRLPELLLRESDYKEIAKIYKKMFSLGISVEGCTFVRKGGKVLMQLPYKLRMSEDPVEECCDKCFSDSVPRGMDITKLRRLVFSNKPESDEDVIEMFEGGYFGTISEDFREEFRECIDNENSDTTTTTTTFFGKLYERNGYIIIKQCAGKEELFDQLLECGIGYGYYSEKLREAGISYYYEDLPELMPEEEDYEKIANIYKKLIKMNIVAESIFFVKMKDEVLIQLPGTITKFTSNELDASRRYYESMDIETDLPYGTDFERVRKMIWTDSEIDELIKIVEGV